MLQLWLVLDNPALLDEVLAAWNDAGVRGITILESTGVHRVRSRASTQDVPFMLGFSRLLRTDQVGHNTLFAVVPNMEVVERLVAATERIVGDLSQPNTGVLFAVPVAAAWGHRPRLCPGGHAGPAPDQPGPDRQHRPRRAPAGLCGGRRTVDPGALLWRDGLPLPARRGVSRAI